MESSQCLNLHSIQSLTKSVKGSATIVDHDLSGTFCIIIFFLFLENEHAISIFIPCGIDIALVVLFSLSFPFDLSDIF